MTFKIKEFKGTLKPVFNDSVLSIEPEDKKSIQFINEIKNSLPIDCIKPRDGQPRKTFNENTLIELTESIKSKGVIQPIIVRIISDGLYEIIVGERRWRAAKRAGLVEIPAIIKDYNELDTIAIALIENIQRENLNPLEEAQAIQELLYKSSMTHAQIAEILGKSRVTVSNLLRLLNLEDEVKSLIKAGLIEMGHARALLALSGQSQVETAKLIIAKSLTVRETERIVQNVNNPIDKPLDFIDSSLQKQFNVWKDYLSKKLMSRVNIHFGSDGKGKLVIHFDSTEEANWLIEHIDIKQESK